jgi:hypothetical protein
MADSAALTPDGLEILLARDLRKAGLDVGRVRRERLQRADDDSGDYRVELTVELRGPRPARLVAEGNRSTQPLDAAAVDRVAARITEREPAGLLLATSGFEPGALSAAADTWPVALLRVSDARAAYDSSGWGPPGQYPIWLPEHLLELANRGPTGAPAYRMLDDTTATDLLTALRLT